MIMKIGNATLMTNLTTASGFATFILTDSNILKEFGIVASINIIEIFKKTSSDLLFSSYKNLAPDFLNECVDTLFFRIPTNLEPNCSKRFVWRRL